MYTLKEYKQKVRLCFSNWILKIENRDSGLTVTKQILCLERLWSAVIVYIFKVGYMVVRSVTNAVCTYLWMEGYKWFDNE